MATRRRTVRAVEDLLGCVCPQCGPRMRCDEDGCCYTCGADTVTPEVLRKIILAAQRKTLPARRPARKGRSHGR